MEEKEKKDQEEAERQRLEELQNKKPEVTITVVNTSGSHGVGPNPSSSSRSNSAKGNKSAKKDSLLVEQGNSGKAEGISVTGENAHTQATSATLQQPPQMVTIKRVMEANGTEPTVTITLKGATPDKDKVLFTLVNGQGDYRTSNKLLLLTCSIS